MAYPDVFGLAKASPDVISLLGGPNPRFWPFGHAAQDEARPYAVHQLVYGSPENTLSCPAETDNIGIQVDSYAKAASDARAVHEALRSALEVGGYVTTLNGEFWEQSTGLYRVSFTIEFWTDR